MNTRLLLSCLCVLVVSFSTCSAARPRSLLTHPRAVQRALLQAQQNAGSYPATPYYFTGQKIDHFGYLRNETWSQKFLLNIDNWSSPATKTPGPIFLYFGNEGPIETFQQNAGFMYDLAPEYRAMLIFPEHRYYGESMPFGSVEASYANTSTLAYFSAEQALADCAYFISWLRNDPSSPCKGNCSQIPVIAFGGSLGGMLAAWLRIKYTAAVQGALAMSAPIWQLTGITPPTTYNAIITKAFGRKYPQCPIGISKVWAIIRDMAKTPAGLNELSNVFKPCGVNGTLGNFSQSYQAVGFADNYLNTAFSYASMANYPYESSFLGPLPANPVNYMCSLGFANITDWSTVSNSTILQAAYAAANVFYNYTGQVQVCNDGGGEPSTLGSVDGWGWQSCTEMVLPIGSYGGDNDMFYPSPWNLDRDIAGCQQDFNQGGWGVTPQPYHLEIEYGGIHLEGASRIFFSNGGLDPWSGGGVNDSALGGLYGPDNPRGVVSYFMDDTAHHLDLRGPNITYDPPSVVYVRQQERAFISAWLDGYDTPTAMAITSSLDSKWIVLISVFSTLLVVIIGGVLFHFCQSKAATHDDGDYASM